MLVKRNINMISSNSICALADDGTVWMYNPGGSRWELLPELPQREVELEPEDEVENVVIGKPGGVGEYDTRQR